MERITEKMLRYQVDLINQQTGQPTEPYGDHGANIGNYHLAVAYGRVALEQMMNTGGGVRRILGSGTKRELYEQLRAFYAGPDGHGGAMKIIVNIRQVYGNEVIYPVCPLACQFALLAGTTTLTRRALEIIRAMGYTIEVSHASVIAKACELNPQHN